MGPLRWDYVPLHENVPDSLPCKQARFLSVTSHGVPPARRLHQVEARAFVAGLPALGAFAPFGRQGIGRAQYDRSLIGQHGFFELCIRLQRHAPPDKSDGIPRPTPAVLVAGPRRVAIESFGVIYAA